jgi:hypothetical protein
MSVSNFYILAFTKMRTKVNLFILFLALFGAACEHTEVIPEDRLSDANFWKNTTDLELYCNNFYTNFNGPSPTYDASTDTRLQPYRIIIYSIRYQTTMERTPIIGVGSKCVVRTIS